MSFKSEAQRRKFYSDPRLHKYVPEFEAATSGHLPERVRPKRHRHLHGHHSPLAAMLAHTRSVHR